MSPTTSSSDVLVAVAVTFATTWLAVVSAAWWRRTLARRRRGSGLVVRAAACWCMVFPGIAALMGVNNLVTLGAPFALAIVVMGLPLAGGVATGVWTQRRARAHAVRAVQPR